MELSKAQSTIFEKARARGAGGQGIALTDDVLRALVALVARDLGLPAVAGIDPLDDREYYAMPPAELKANGAVSGLSAYCSLLQVGPVDTDTYFSSLAALHRARLKFANIMRFQETPSLEQVGPRGLLQYGELSPEALGSLLIVRKWLYDIDNRSAQETGYLVEPIIAGAVGGMHMPAKSSPIKREGVGSGRQVDCLKGNNAYEIKMRVTIAASGQGRWGEELSFPADCAASGYTPVLVVFDGTANPKLSKLCNAFQQHGGQAHIGEDAWRHLQSESGPTMGAFIKKYIQAPLDDLLVKTPTELPAFHLQLQRSSIKIRVGAEEVRFDRTEAAPPTADAMPDDADTALPGPD
ncbi:MAG: hypothetical protein OXE79_09870 [Acidimicrobiaceae bacterium]|nr:hypothetical protein [Acidimicrobiaceae bacterium]MCY4175180.1 hypothetical protein [Acidimicrobiaceae bacterium]MCY4279443.1 hypothetical protein [Acidimicrobiaceae bacterium]MCY4294727.1 hypothetical protein [Acidimicrobiaceae bacterium]